MRQSFSVEYHKCSPNATSECKNQTMTQLFHDTYYYTMFILTQRMEIDINNIQDNKLKTVSVFHSQFMIDPTVYRDNNNFLRVNKVEVNTNRWQVMDTATDLRYVDFSIRPPWNGKPGVWIVNMSRDAGKSFAQEDALILYGSYFFVGDEISLQSVSVYGWMQILGDFGGTLEITIFVFIILCTSYNATMINAKAIRALYYDSPHPGEDGVQSEFGKAIKFRFLDKFTRLRNFSFCGKKAENHNHELYDKGKKRMKEDLNLFRIVQQIYKLRAIVIQLGNKAQVTEDFYENVKTKYFEMVTLETDDEAEKAEVQIDERLEKFLARDEKINLYQCKKKDASLSKRESFMRRMSSNFMAGRFIDGDEHSLAPTNSSKVATEEDVLRAAVAATFASRNDGTPKTIVSEHETSSESSRRKRQLVSQHNPNDINSLSEESSEELAESTGRRERNGPSGEETKRDEPGMAQSFNHLLTEDPPYPISHDP